MGTSANVEILQPMFHLAERVGFEPTDAFTSPVFKTGAFDHSAISPCVKASLVPNASIILPCADAFVNKKPRKKFEKNSNEKVDALIVAVAHNEYKNMSIQDIKDKLNETSILFDIKGLFNKNEIEKEKIEYWSL